MSRSSVNLIWAVVISFGTQLPSACAQESEVQFNRDVLPILSDTCFACHGPDSRAREADLRLDQRDGLLGRSEAGPIVRAGHPEQSELWKRISSADPDLKMPPPDQTRQLSKQQIRTLRLWVEQGAQWEGHWAFQPIERPSVPEVKRANRTRNPIDHFVQRQAESRGLSPASEADAATLIRRVTLDLTGLPPTPREVESFVSDRSPDRYEKLVDRLLSSASYGEHMTTAWLDAARYADTSGYQNDGPREMWRWRDWVIDARNSDMPFDQFSIEQLAGDLLPDATTDQLIATGFNRNHRGNSEGGIIPEEFAVEYVVDRVDTTGTVWLGLTIGCARCHSHKFDPVTQNDYYRLFAYFNGVSESGRAIKEGNSPPYLKTPTRDQKLRLEQLNRNLQQAAASWKAVEAQVEPLQREWEQSLASGVGEPVDWIPESGLIDSVSFNGRIEPSPPTDGEKVRPQAVGGPLEFNAETRPSVRLNGKQFIDAGNRGRFTYFDSFSVAAWVRPTGDLTGGIVTRMSDDSYSDGWALHLEDGEVQVNLVKRWLDDSLRVGSSTRLPADQWSHVCMTYDGSRTAAGIAIYVNGVIQGKVIHLDGINQSMENDEPLRIGSTGTHSRFDGSIGTVQIYSRVLDSDEALTIATDSTVTAISGKPVKDRSEGEHKKVRAAFLAQAAPRRLQEPLNALQRIREDRDLLLAKIPTTMVMDQMSSARETFVLNRGAYDRPAEQVKPGIPAALNPQGPELEGDRLTLAKWIVGDSNPLAARVVVNREWERFFGIGIVATSEDLGTQGARPTHPELLDWLATELKEQDWSLKSLHRLIVTSSTYRQSSNASAESLARDPANRWLSRGARFRLSAETIRDQALAVSGLLSQHVGGPSVFPYQPEGLWKDIASTSQYERSQGRDLYRRSLYSYWKRTVTNPTLGAFDVPTREACVVSRTRTNTPLQALTLLNDVTFVEAARRLAEQTLDQKLDGERNQLAWIFRRVTARSPSSDELDVLENGLRWHTSRFSANVEDADELLAIGDSSVRAKSDRTRLAALTAMASVVLNLDEVVMRN